MRTPTSTRRAAPAFNMTPLIDIVFMLILFFTLTLHLEREQTRKLELPKADQAEVVEKLPPQSLPVVVEEDGTLLVNGRPTLLADFESRLFATPPEGLPKKLVLRADAFVPYERVQGVMSAASRAGISEVELVASRESEDLR